jgi:hypothetical protein
MEVLEWVNAPHAIVSQQHTSSRLWSPAILGLAGTLLMHATVIESLYVANRSHDAHPPEILEAGGRGVGSKSDSAENLVLIDLPLSVNYRDQVTVNVAAIRALSKAAFAMPVDPDPPVFPSVETLALDEQSESAAISASGDGEDRTRLIGIYSGQVQARIERAWSRPRTPVNDGNNPTNVDYFHCEAQIVQDSGGNVQEILLLNCNGTPSWQRSLVLAIQQASPLPAPPDPAVFSRSMSLNLVGNPYVAGRSEDGYETLRVEAAQATTPARHLLQMVPESLPFRPIDEVPAR